MTAETKLFVVVGPVKNRPYNLAIASEKIRRWRNMWFCDHCSTNPCETCLH